MPKYEINGKIYEFESEPSVEDIDFIAGSEDSKTKTKWYEDIGAGARDVGKSMAHGIALGAAGLTTGERQQEILGNIQDLRKSQQADEAGLDRGESGKVLKAVGALPAFLNPVTGGMAIAGGAAETGMQLADEGAGAGTALAGMGADAGINLATMGLAGKAQVAGKAANALLQGGVNVTQEALLNHPVQNLIRSNAGIKDLPDLTIGDIGAAAIPGMAIGAMTAKPKIPTSGNPDLTTVAPRTVADLDAAHVELNTAKLDSISAQYDQKVKQQADLMKSGSMSEKQKAWYDSLEQQKEKLILEHKKISDNLAKYQEPKVEGETPLTEEETIAQLDLSFIDEVQKAQLGLDTLPTEDDFHQIILAEQERIRNTLPTGEAFRDDVTVDNTLVSSKGTGNPVLGQNQQGVLKVNPEHAKILFDSLTPEQQFSFGSARGLQLFAEIHEAVHNLVKRKDGESIKDYEFRTNRLIAEEWKAQGLDQGESGTRRISRKLLNTFDQLVAERAKAEETPEPPAYLNEAPFFDEAPPPESVDVESFIPAAHRKEYSDTFTADLANGKYNNPVARQKETVAKRKRLEKVDERVRNALEASLRNPNDTASMKTYEDNLDLKNRMEAELEALDKLGKGLEKNRRTNIDMEDELPFRKKVVLNKRTRFTAKDQIKSDKANKFIGRGSFFSSTEDYARSWGELANTGQYSNTDTVFISAEGNRSGRVPFDKVELQKALDAGAKIITDDFDNRNRSHNVGEREVTKYLVDNGYQEVRPGEWSPRKNSQAGPGGKQGGAVLNPAQVLDAVKESVAKMHDAADVADNVDVTKLKTSDELVVDPLLDTKKDIGSGRIARNFFGIGQLVEGLKREAPLVWEAFKRIKMANDAEVWMKRKLWSGDGSGMSPKGILQFMKLKHYEDPETLAQVVPQLTPESMVKTFEYVRDNSNKLQQHDRGDMSGFTPKEKKAVLLLKEMYDQVKLITGVKQRNGYIHGFRSGEFAVALRTSQGDVAHVEPFPTAKIAQEFIAEAKKLGHDVSGVIDFKTEAGIQLGESFGIVKDILENTFSKDPKALNTTLKTLDEIQQRIADKATIGKHNVRKEGYSGFEGTRLLRSREQNAKDFWNSVEDYIGQVSSQHKKTLLNRSRTEFWENDAGRELASKFPNQKQLSDFLYDHAANSLNKFGLGEWVDQVRPMIDNLFTDTVKSTVGAAKKIPIVGKKITMDERFYYPDVPVLDKTVGMAAQLFYISALTTRPGFWVGQLLSAPFAVRQFLKEGTVLDAIVSSGKGWGTIMSGGDAEFRTFIKDMVNKTGSTHPQFKNEINEIPFFNSKTNNTLNKIFEFGTGQTFGGMADSASRYFTIATAYHHYKALGMKDEALFRNVQNAVDNTMVMYSRDQSSPMFSRLGIVGQQIAPLQKYSVAQLGNLIGDLKYIGQQKGGINKIRAMAPAISTLLTTMIMSGSIGLPLLAEYEVIRKGFVWANEQFGLGIEDYIPKSVYENMLSNKNVIQSFAASAYEGAGTSKEFAKDASNFGVLSASTGFDIGSSLRFNPYLPGADGAHQGSLINSFPLIKFSLDAATSVLAHTKKYSGADTSIAEQRKADLSLQVFPGQRYLIDKLKYESDTRPMVPGGSRDYGQVEQTSAEQMGQVLGSPTISTVKTKLQNQIELEKDKKRAANRQKAVDMMVDSIATGDTTARERALDLAVKADMTHKTFKEGVMTAARQRVTDRETARLTGKKGYPKSHDQLIKYLEMQQYE